MFLRPYTFLFTTLFFFSLLSCSTTKKGVLNQGYHALTTKYNVLFNGKEAFTVGEAILEEALEDNFYELLPVEPIILRGENIDETTIVPGFDRAEEKAVKSIQKHSMNINDIQYNSQMDEAYLLLGKARYFDRRFFPALEAFNYLLESGANPSNYVEGKIWREKTNIRLRNVELAIDNLTPLARSLVPNNRFYPQANATLADAYINLKQLDSASFYIKRAALKEPKRENKARYLFITGQLFESLDKRDSAQWAYSEILALKRKAPRKFLIQAEIKTRMEEEEMGFEERVGAMQKLLKNYENQPFEHILNRAIAKLYLQQNQDSLALDYFNKSMTSTFLDSYTEIENFQDLADYHFAKGAYLKSGSFLDKLLPLFDEKTTAYKKLKRKRDNLDEVIAYEKTVQDTDSLIGLMSLSQAEQLAYFENYIEEKQQKEILQLQEENAEKRFQFLNRTKTAFYFYNPNQLLQGKQTYLANWGNRPNVDNWRSASAIINLSLEEENGELLKEGTASIIQETPESFIAELPKTEREKDSLILLNQKAYLQLGMIYKEKFNDFPLAQQRLQKVLSLDPTDEIAVQALYHLYRMEEQEESTNADTYKQQLIANYPETPFARLLSDPENYDTSGMITPETLYAKALDLFENQQLLETLESLEELTVLASGSPIEPKINLLKAHTLGRLNGVAAWKASLNEVATNFSAVEEGIQAKALLAEIEALNDLEETGVIYKNYKWVFPFPITEKENAQKFLTVLGTEVKTYNRFWSVSLDAYNKEFVFVVVHGIRDPKEIENWKIQQERYNSTTVQNDNFVTLASQYREYMKNKTWINTIK
jgi:tetratricopeptide (TPR) repeat protein